MATLAVTNSFSAGTTIVAADMNENFDDVEAFVNSTPGVIQNDIVDVKGDIIAATAADAVSRLAVGSNTYVLTADSTEATGLIWSAAPTPTTITVADTTDATCFVGVFESVTGDLAPKTDAALLYNASTGSLQATVFTGPLTGLASSATTAGVCTGNSLTATTAGTVTTAAQGNITSVGSLTGLTVAGNLTVTGQTINHLVIENNSDAAIAPAVGDENTYFVTTHATAVVTLPQDSAQDFEIGTVMYFERNGTGTLTFAAGTGASVTSKDGTLTCGDRYTTVATVKVSANGWSLIGNIG
jgi:hypothetical protein